LQACDWTEGQRLSLGLFFGSIRGPRLFSHFSPEFRSLEALSRNDKELSPSGKHTVSGTVNLQSPDRSRRLRRRLTDSHKAEA
jgi:hypothetical protein